MKASLIVGILLVALGTAALIYKDFSYTTEETVAQIGPLKATAETEKNIPIPGALGILAIATGIVVIVIGSKRK